MPIPVIPPEFDELSPAEKIEYVQRLWERIAEDPELVAMTEEQIAELDRRLQAYHDNPKETAPWQEIRDRLRSGQ